jgi:hypothetical protein
MGQIGCPETSIRNYQSTLRESKTLSNSLSNLLVQINLSLMHIFRLKLGMLLTLWLHLLLHAP